MPNPDYVITKVSYDNDHSRITHVKRAEYDNSENKFGSRTEKSRQVVVESIESGFEYYTVPPDGDGGYTWGDSVEVIPIDGEKFIRTDGNKVEEDNLGELPEY
ncbi:DUF3892 domain-containing protein [Halorubrum laminariae]|uniref:DUF3892 domain-containing protein n=1 Tax=Halorubrum laminariae TaxID=1433523 RepID=A0ABD6C070_9EURY|nr:DUF3892 domain-containing protein [Halorubrum laminariae]